MSDVAMTAEGEAAAAPRAAMTTAREPDGAPRVASLDILRGIAILGILFMNINDMGQSMTASFNDVRHLGWTAADQVAWWLREILANGTTRCLLEMLFGVGMVILTDRAATRAGEWAVLRGYYLRNVVLFLFGIVHMYLLMWPGDILHTYGLAALIAVLFRSQPPRALIAFGLAWAMLQLGAGGYFGYVQPMQQRAHVAALKERQAHGTRLDKDERQMLKDAAEDAKAAADRRAERTRDIAAEDAGRLGTFVTWARAQYDMSRSRFPDWGELFSVWEAAGTMLIGAALFRLGIIQGDRPRRFYLLMMLAAYAVAIPLRTLGAWEQTRFDDVPKLYYATTEIARQAMTLGHIGLIHLLLGTAIGGRLLRPFAAAGRTALTVYIAQTLICLWVLYPPFMLGLYRQQGWMALMLTAIAIDAALLWGANLYLRHFAIAPVEWAWRSIIAGTKLPIRRGTRADRPQRAPLPA